VTGEVYNNSNTPQTVTLVSYKEFYPDTNFDDKNVNGVLVPGQRVHNYQTVTVPANGHVNLTAQLPGCSTQIDLVCADVIQYLGGGNLYGMRKLAYYHAHQPNNAWCNSTGVTSWNGAFEAAAQAAVDAAAADAAAQAAADAAAKAAADKAAADAATKAAADAAAAQAATEAAEAAAQQAAAAKAAEEAAAAQAAADAAAAQATADAIAAEAAAKAAEEAAAAEAAAKAAAEAAAAAAAQQAAEAAAQQAAAETAAAEAAAKAAAEAVAKAADEEAKKAAEEAQKKADEEAAANKLAEEEAAKAAEEAAAEAKKQADEAAAAEEAAAKAAEEAAKVAEEATKTAEDANCAGTTGADAPTSTTVSWADDKGTNSYDFTVTKEGNTWTYQVDKAGGKDLSHWTLIAPSCVTHVGNATNGVEIGQDGSIKDRDVSGIKWNTTGGTFSFTLDGDYAVNTVEVLAKAGNSYSTSMIMGPDCSMPASNQCPPKDPEVPVAVSGAFYNADDSICSYVPKATQSKNGKDLSGWTVPQWVAVEGYIEATKGGEPAGETTVALVGNDTVKICSAGLMVGSCHEDDAKAMQSVTTNEEGKADFTALVYWPGVSAADRAEGGTVNSSYSVNVMGGPAGTTVVGGLAKQLLWNPGMMNSGCTLTLKAKKNHN
jgi:chemotaxis protein histidine kinase CheA